MFPIGHSLRFFNVTYVEIPKKFAGVQTFIIFTRYHRDRQRQSCFYKSYNFDMKKPLPLLIRSCIPIQPGLSDHLMTLNLWPLCSKVILPNIGWQVTAAETPMISARAFGENWKPVIINALKGRKSRVKHDSVAVAWWFWRIPFLYGYKPPHQLTFPSKITSFNTFSTKNAQ